MKEFAEQAILEFQKAAETAAKVTRFTDEINLFISSKPTSAMRKVKVAKERLKESIEEIKAVLIRLDEVEKQLEEVKN